MTFAEEQAHFETLGFRADVALAAERSAREAAEAAAAAQAAQQDALLAAAREQLTTVQGNLATALSDLQGAQGDRDAALRRVAELTGELTAALATITRHVATIDQLRARIAELETPAPTAPTPLYAGARPLGTTAYPIPATNVRFVAPGGANSAAGTLAAPYASVQYAISQVPAGGTIVLRGGSYHELVNIPTGKALTFQAYPGEVVWLDGSSVVTGWAASGNVWTAPYAFAASRVSAFPGSDPYRGHTDQVWLDGVMLKQVADATTPAAGQFSVNQTTKTLTIGTSPVGKEVRASDLGSMVWQGQVKVLGIGIRRYAPQQLSDLSAMVTLRGTSAGSLFENVWLEGSSFSGLSLDRADITVRSCTVQDVMLTGIVGTTCHRGVVEKTLIRRGNLGLYEQAPTTGGMKFTRADGMIIRWNWVEDCPKANLVWFDVSCTRTRVYGNHLDGRDKGRGVSESCVFIEISDGGIYDGVQHRNWLVGNRTLGAKFPLRNVGSGFSNWWNNSCGGYVTAGFSLGQDRDQNSGAPGNLTKDTAPWWNTNTQLVNPDIGYSNTGAGIQIMAYSDYKGAGTEPFTGWDMFELIAGCWTRPAPPGSMAQMGKLDGSRNSYNSWPALAASTPDVGGPPGLKLGAGYQSLTPPTPAQVEIVALPLPAEVAEMLGLPVGSKSIGPNEANLPVLTPGG